MNFIKVIIIYILVLNLSVCYVLLVRIDAILGNFNMFFLSLLLLNIFLAAVNMIFLFRKNANKNYKLILIYNAIFSMISGLDIRAFGSIISNNLGIDLGLYFTKNFGGTDYGFKYGIFHLSMQLSFYDDIKYTGFSVKLNLIILFIGVLLFYFYNKMRRYNLEIIP
jgi:hypothetical protein